MLPAAPPRALEPTRAPLLREGLRAATAFSFYLGFKTVGEWTGLETGYWHRIAAFLHPLLKRMAHFEGLPASAARPENQHSHLALIAALFLVSWSIPWPRRTRVFGILAGLAVLQDLCVAGLSLSMHEAKSLYDVQGWVVLLPWEYNTLQLVWYLLYAIPLEFIPFLLFFLVGLWNAGIEPRDWLRGPAPETQAAPEPLPRRVSIPRRLAVAGAGIILTVAGAGFWIHERNADPLHRRTHRLLGLMRHAHYDDAVAERQLRTALQEGSTEPAVQIGLAEVLRDRGRPDEAVAILRTAAGTHLTETDRTRVGALLESMGSSDPLHPAAIEAVPPPSRP